MLARAPCWLLELPDEVLRRVLEYLCPASLQFAGSTCGQLRRATAAPDLVEAVVRGSGEFWAPLAYNQPARSLIDRLLPNGLAGPSLAVLRRYFSGTQPAAAPASGDDLFLYGTLERGGEVVATCGPIDAGDVQTSLYFDHNSFFEPSYLGVTIPMNWKSTSVMREYTKPTLCWREFKKAVTMTFYALTHEGAYLISRVSVKEGSLGPTSRDGEIEPNYVGWWEAVGLHIPITNNTYGRSNRLFMPEAPKRHDIHLQVVDRFRPTVREVIAVV